MTNADKFKNLFGVYATELWSMPEKDFLKWLNSEVMNCSEIPNNSDLISRQAAIEKFAMTAPQMSVIRIYEAVEILESMPTIQPEPQEGHWIGKYPTTHICSECGWLIPDSKVKVFAYCPNCGARMKGERQK